MQVLQSQKQAEHAKHVRHSDRLCHFHFPPPTSPHSTFLFSLRQYSHPPFCFSDQMLEVIEARLMDHSQSFCSNDALTQVQTRLYVHTCTYIFVAPDNPLQSMSCAHHHLLLPIPSGCTSSRTSVPLAKKRARLGSSRNGKWGRERAR
jgi:hypothetical protein